MFCPIHSRLFATTVVCAFAWCSSAYCQDVTYDNLTLDDGTSIFPSLSFQAANNGLSTFKIKARDNSIGLFRPNQPTIPAFALRSDAGSNTLVLDDIGVGIGLSFPKASLHIYGKDQGPGPFDHPWIFIEDASVDSAHRVLMLLANNGGSSLRMENTDTGHSWQTSVLNNGDFRISLDASGGHEFRLLRNGRLVIGPGNQTVFDLKPNGNLFLSGTLAQRSDRNSKENFSDVDCQEVLNALVQIPIQSWNYKADANTIRHIGPMAQDFYGKFKVGLNDTTISTVDTAGVSMAAIKALATNNRQLRENDRVLEQQNRQLTELVEQLEQRMSDLESSDR